MWVTHLRWVSPSQMCAVLGLKNGTSGLIDKISTYEVYSLGLFVCLLKLGFADLVLPM